MDSFRFAVAFALLCITASLAAIVAVTLTISVHAPILPRKDCPMSLNRIALVALGGLFFVVLSLVYAFSADISKMQAQMLAPSVQLNGNCSGSVIWSDRNVATGSVTTYVLTARHCVEGVSDKDMMVDVPVYQKMRIVKKERFIARVKAQDSRADLALIVLKDRQTWIEHKATIASEEALIAMGEPVWTVGYPLGMALTITGGFFGSIETVNYPKNGVEYFRATPDIAPGNSGGALYHMNKDGDYRLIGITTAGWRGYPYMALYTKLADIRDFLSRVAPEVLGRKPKTPASH